MGRQDTDSKVFLIVLTCNSSRQVNGCVKRWFSTNISDTLLSLKIKQINILNETTDMFECFVYNVSCHLSCMILEFSEKHTKLRLTLLLMMNINTVNSFKDQYNTIQALISNNIFQDVLAK